MAKRFHLRAAGLAEAMVAALSLGKDVKAQRRLRAMRLAASGQFTAAPIAEQMGISRRQFFHWINALKAGGADGLLEREHGGGRAARGQGRARAPLQAGLRTGRWKRAKAIQQWLRQRHETKLTLKGVDYWLGKLGGVLKVPRKTPAQKDGAARAEFQRTLGARLQSWKGAGGRRVRVGVAEEHRYGLIPVVRRCWSLRGLRPTAPYQTKDEWGYLYSALEVDGENAAEFACWPGVSLELSHRFVTRVAARDPAAEHVGIWEQAGLHPNPEWPGLPARIHRLARPPSRPELHPVEVIGDLIKDRIANTHWPTLEALEEALGEELRPIDAGAERVRRLVSHPWLLDQVNVTAAKNSAVTC